MASSSSDLVTKLYPVVWTVHGVWLHLWCRTEDGEKRKLQVLGVPERCFIELPKEIVDSAGEERVIKNWEGSDYVEALAKALVQPFNAPLVKCFRGRLLLSEDDGAADNEFLLLQYPATVGNRGAMAVLREKEALSFDSAGRTYNLPLRMHTGDVDGEMLLALQKQKPMASWFSVSTYVLTRNGEVDGYPMQIEHLLPVVDQSAAPPLRIAALRWCNGGFQRASNKRNTQGPGQLDSTNVDLLLCWELFGSGEEGKRQQIAFCEELGMAAEELAEEPARLRLKLLESGIVLVDLAEMSKKHNLEELMELLGIDNSSPPTAADLLQIFEKMGGWQLLVELAALTGVQPGRCTLGPLRMVYGALLQIAQDRHLIMNLAATPPAMKIQGGRSECVAGCHSNVISLDFSSDYPNIIVELNLGHETMNNRGATACDGRRTGLAELCMQFIQGRDQIKAELKKEMPQSKRTALQLKEKALKLLANSLFGALSSKFSKLYAPKIANKVTEMGRDMLGRVKTMLDGNTFQSRGQTFKMRAIHMQTDGIMVSCDGPPLDPLDGECLAKLVNKNLGYDRLKMKFEHIFPKIIFVNVNEYVALQPGGELFSCGGCLNQNALPLAAKKLMQKKVQQLLKGNKALDSDTEDLQEHGLPPKTVGEVWRTLQRLTAAACGESCKLALPEPIKRDRPEEGGAEKRYGRSWSFRLADAEQSTEEILIRLEVHKQDGTSTARYSSFSSMAELYEYAYNPGRNGPHCWPRTQLPTLHEVQNKDVRRLMLEVDADLDKFPSAIQKLIKQNGHDIGRSYVLRPIISAIKRLLREQYCVELNPSADLMVLEAHREKKTSFHIIAPRLHHSTAAEARYFAQEVVNLLHNDGNNDVAEMIDLGVYSTNHSLRMYSSIKVGEPGSALAKYAGRAIGTWDFRKVFDGLTEEDTLERTLVCSGHLPEAKLLPNKVQARQRTITATAYTVEEVRKMTADILATKKSLRGFTVDNVTSTLVRLRVSRSYECPVCQRKHDRKPLSVSFRRDGHQVTCWSGGSEWMSLADLE